MPKTKLQKTMQNTLQNRFNEVIKGRAAFHEKNITQIAKDIGMDKSTLYRRINDPEIWNIRELMCLIKVLEINCDQLLYIFGMKRGDSR